MWFAQNVSCCASAYRMCMCEERTLSVSPEVMILLSMNNNNKKKSLWQKRKMPQRLRCESTQRSGAWGEVRRGWPLLAVMKEKEHITGSSVLCERDREGFTKKEVTWKRESQSEREVRRPLESTLRLTPSYSPPFSICKYSTSSEDSSEVLAVFDVILFIYYLGRWWCGGKYLLVYLWSHRRWLML